MRGTKETQSSTRSRDAERRPRSRASLATVLALLTVLTSAVVAYIAYQGSRRALTDQLAMSSKTLARSVQAHSERLVENGVLPQTALRQAWAGSGGEQEGMYLCFVGRDGKLDVHTRFSEHVGVPVNEMQVSDPGDAPASVADLLRERRSWTGENFDLRGQPQIVSFSYSQPLDGLVAVHVPQALIDDFARAGMLPWAYGMGAVTLILLPTALWLLHGMHRRAELALARVHREREELAEQLTRSRRLESLGRLAGGIAHDFNNLLMVVMGGTDGLEEEKLSPEGQEDVRDIRSAAERGSKLVKQMLTFGARRKVEEEVFEAGTLLEGLIDMLERLVGDQVRLDLDLGDAECRVRADRGQLEQVITNLVLNARDAMPDGGRVVIRARETAWPKAYLHVSPRTEHCVCLSVEDEGIGMTNQVLERAMEPFFTTKKKQGTGLGLATAYGIAKQHGGHLAAESEPGRGTKISLYLPIVQDEVTPDAPRAKLLSSAAEGLRVLVVEDEDRVRRSIVRALQKYGYEVKTASGAEEARRLFGAAQRPFSLLVTDVAMPGEPGDALARALLEDSEDLRVLLVSGYAPGSETEQQNDPRIAFLAKPFTAAAVHAKLEELIAGQSMPRRVAP